MIRAEGAIKSLDQKRTIQRVGEQAAGKATVPRGSSRNLLILAGALVTLIAGLSVWGAHDVSQAAEQRRKEREKTHVELINALDQLFNYYTEKTAEQREHERIMGIINSRPSGSGACCPGMR